MFNKIHILGASGSGTSTLGKAIVTNFGHHHLDTDDYYWQKTAIPFTLKRERIERIKLLKKATQKHPSWVLSGSLCGWGDELIAHFDLVIYVYLESNIRLERLKQREINRYGTKISKDGEMFEIHKDFMAYAAQYDLGGLDMRSKKTHDEWLKKIPCKTLLINGDVDIPEKINRLKKLYDLCWNKL